VKEEEEFLEVIVELGKNNEKHLIIHGGDNIEKVANTFCSKHKLNQRQRQILIQQIKTALNKVRQSENVEDEEANTNKIIPSFNPRICHKRDPIQEGKKETKSHR